MATATPSLPPTPRPLLLSSPLLQSWLTSGSSLQLALHEIECQQQIKGREVQRLLLQAHLQQRGNGDVGPALYLRRQDGEVTCSHRRLGTRSLTTVFGTVELVRMGYSQPGLPGIFPPGSGADSARPFVLLRTPAPSGVKPPCRILSSIRSKP